MIREAHFLPCSETKVTLRPRRLAHLARLSPHNRGPSR